MASWSVLDEGWVAPVGDVRRGDDFHDISGRESMRKSDQVSEARRQLGTLYH